MKSVRIAVVAALAGVVLTGCGQAGSDGQPTGTGGTVTSSPTGPETGPTARPSPSGPLTPTSQPTGVPTTKEPTTPGGGKSTGPIVLTGTIRAGVEPGCLLLDDYLLVGGPKDVLRSGARVTVTGRVEPDLLTTCMQGTPFIVERAQPA